jgi:predicted AlkP superfamily pyrophosphatase or phosphodiesterase
MTHATVFIIVDAGRADYVRPDTMPFVHGLQRDGLRGTFLSPPGFAQRTVLFTGRYPDTSNNFSAFVFDPDNSPFAWVRSLGPMGGLLKPYKAMVPGRWALARLTKWFTKAYHADPAWIPPRFLPFFRPCEDMRPIHEPGALGGRSIYDLCRDHGLAYRYLAHPVSGNDEDVYRTLTRELRAGAPYRLYTAQFSAFDQQGHVHGPGSGHMQRKVLPDLDRKLAGVHAALSAGYDSWDLFLCGDHGMGPVHQQVNVLQEIARSGAKPGEDYVVFVNSTLAVLWYLTEKGRREVEAVLPTIPGSDPVSMEERRQRRIPTDRQWGDRMLAARPGVLYWPDYFHVRDSRIVGMHGYLDKSQEGMGMGVVAGSNGGIGTADWGNRSLADVFPTLCNLLDVPVPGSNEGRSLLAPYAAPVPA